MAGNPDVDAWLTNRQHPMDEAMEAVRDVHTGAKTPGARSRASKAMVRLFG